MIALTPSQTSFATAVVRNMPIRQRIDWLMDHAHRHSVEFQSSESYMARSLYMAQHPTAIVALNCMDGRINISVATDTPAGIILPIRNLGGRFSLGWPYFGEVLTGHVRSMVGQGRRTLMLITYHYSKGDSHRGCAGFGYDTDAARSHTLEIKRQVEAVFGSSHNTVYPLVCGFETDEDALVLHGIGGEVLDLSTISPAIQDTLPAVLARLYPGMPDQIRQDLLPLVQGNLSHIAGVRQSTRELESEHVEHHEWMLGVGRGFDWLHMPNLALIIGPYSPDLAEPIRKAAGIIEANMKMHRIPDDGFLLLVASPYHEIGVDRALAEVKSRFLSEFAVGIIRAECPNLKDKMHVRSSVITWESQMMEVIDCPVARTPVSIPNQIERSAEMQARIYVADDEPLILNALVKRLSQGQHQVQAFKSGDELLSALEKHIPDLIFLDVKMPGRTGIETLAAIRKKTHDAVVIMLTAYGTVEEAVEAMKLGAYDFLIKTLDLALVEPVVVRALEHASNRGRK